MGQDVAGKSIQVGDLPPPAPEPPGVLVELREHPGRVRVLVGHSAGTSRVAAAYARERLNAGVSLLAWLAGDSPQSLWTGLAELARSVGEAAPHDGSYLAAMRVKAYLENRDDPALLVIADAADPALVTAMLPAGGPTEILLTTTGRAFDSAGAVIHVGGYEQSEPYELGLAAGAAGLLSTIAVLAPTGVRRALLAELADTAGHLDELAGLTEERGDTLALPGPVATAARERALADHTLDGVLRHLAERLIGLLPGIQEAARLRPRVTELAIHSTAVWQHAAANASHLDRETVELCLEAALCGDQDLARAADHHLAIALAERLAVEAAAVLGTDHPLLLHARSDLGWTYLQTGQYPQGIAQLERAAADAARLNEPERDRLSHRNLLACAYEMADRVPEAIAMHEEVLAIRERTLDRGDRDIAYSRSNLAAACISDGRGAEALRQLKLMDRYGPALPREHPSALYRRRLLGTAYRLAGRRRKAIRVMESAAADSAEFLGTHHPDTLRQRRELAHSYAAVGRYPDAIEVLRDVNAVAAGVWGVDGDETFHARKSLGTYLTWVPGREREAVQVFREMVDDCEQVRGTDDERTLQARGCLADAHRLVGNWVRAFRYYEGVVADRKRIHGDDDRRTLDARRRLAEAHGFIGQHLRATRCYEELLADCDRVLGREDPLTVRTAQGLTEAHARQGTLAKSFRAIARPSRKRG